MQTLISVIMPIKNGENYMEEAIDSIKKQNLDTEIIVIDDGSTDNTADLAKKKGCRVIKHPSNMGQVVAKNTGLKFANGNFIIFCDHDDILEPNALHMMLEELKKDTNLMAVIAKVKDFISPDTKKQNLNIKTEPYYGCLGGAVLLRKSVFDIIGNFDESIQAGEALTLISKLAQNHLKIKKVNFISSNRRHHDTNYGRTNQKDEYKDYAKILRERLRK